jgi:Zn-dependent M16 (insulinase) family peptidase
VPKLTHEAFCEFHRRYYSASNARIFLYGDIPTKDHLEFLAEQLADFGVIEVDSSVPLQRRWDGPCEVRAEFPVGEQDPLEKRATVNVAWLTADADDLEERLALEVLEQALVGNAAAPLRKALIDSGLGEDLSPLTGLANWYKQLPFVVGLRGSDAEKAEAIEKLTLETLERICREGIAREVLEGAFHQVEFRGLEITRSGLPFPLILLFRAMSTWLHDLDPLVPLTFPTLIASLRERWAADPQLFEKAIRRWLLENPHRLRAIAAPSRTLGPERERALRAELAARRAAMTESEVDGIRREVEELTREQRTPDPPEVKATLPRLRVSEIPREVETLPTEERAIGGAPAWEHDVFSNGIAYRLSCSPTCRCWGRRRPAWARAGWATRRSRGARRWRWAASARSWMRPSASPTARRSSGSRCARGPCGATSRRWSRSCGTSWRGATSTTTAA